MTPRTSGRSAACRICGKDFARSDTLLRHEKNHHATEDRGPLHRVTDGIFRACSACATARSRCSGGTPCGRCGLRKIECDYPNKRPKTAHARDVPEVDAPPLPGRQSIPLPMPAPAATGVLDGNKAGGEAQFPHIDKPPATRSSPVGHSPTVQGVPPYQHPIDNHPTYRPGFQADIIRLQHEHALLPPTSFTSMQPLEDHFEFHPEYGAAPFDYSTFEEPMNWIPISVYPSPYENEFEHDVSFLFPPLAEPSNPTPEYHQHMSQHMSGETFRPPEQPSPLVSYSTSNHVNVHPISAVDRNPRSSISNEHPAHKSTASSVETVEIKKKRRKSSFIPNLFQKPQINDSRYAFPDLSSSTNLNCHSEPQNYCSPAAYNLVHDSFRKLCLDTDLSKPFVNSNFPPYDCTNKCIELYFENFHPRFPIIHTSTFGSDAHWIVLLACASLGSTFVEEVYASELQEAFQEFLRRAIHHYADGSPDCGLDLPLAYARILNLIGLAVSNRDQLRDLAPRYHADLSRWCLESGVLQISETGDPVDPASDSSDLRREWEAWIWTESLRRIGYFVWLLDTSLGYLANCRPLCNMDDARTALPCVESIWSAQSPEAWKSAHTASEQPPSLCGALEHLYAKKSLPPQLSDISQILIINALFQRTWEVGTHIKQPLSEWVPTGKARGFLNTPSKDSFWLPLYPLYANWRNSACDCLDVIHWQAASAVAKASGVEHDLMLHLHLARIILLTPFQEIQDLVFSLIGRVSHTSRASFYVHDGSYQPRNLAKLPQIRKITWRWLREDQHKARLAIVHAGSVFWHVRRYSSRSFYEPLAVYLASMVLWTYGSYKSAALERDAAANTGGKPVGGPSGPDSDLNIVQPSRVERRVRRKLSISKQKQSEHPIPHPDQSQHAKTPSHDTLSQPSVSQTTSNPHPSTGQPPQSPSPSHSSSPSTPSPAPSASSSSSSSSSSQTPQFIHLDRPCDDEMVQHFVRHGHHMAGYMSGVGDICSTPNKVLLEGAKLLRTRLGCWGVSREYFDVLMGVYNR